MKDIVRGQTCNEDHLMEVRLLSEDPQAEVLQEDQMKEVIHENKTLGFTLELEDLRGERQLDIRDASPELVFEWLDNC
jgi:hypothetical protein